MVLGKADAGGGLDVEVSDAVRPDPGETVLPALVRRYLDRVLTGGCRGKIPRQVRVTQAGEMRQKPGGSWRRFTAVEDFAVGEVAYSWRARFPIAPLIWLDVVDGYTGGEGFLEARVWGRVRVIRARGQDVSEGEALRYLFELPWAPHAILANSELEWRELDRRTVEVATQVGPARLAARLEFDATGDIIGASCDARPYLEGKTSVPRPWVGSFCDYAIVGGIRLPTRAEVRWELPDGPFPYWRGTIASLELDP
jgi:hypothetical protein